MLRRNMKDQIFRMYVHVGLCVCVSADSYTRTLATAVRHVSVWDQRARIGRCQRGGRATRETFDQWYCMVLSRYAYLSMHERFISAHGCCTPRTTLGMYSPCVRASANSPVGVHQGIGTRYIWYVIYAHRISYCIGLHSTYDRIKVSLVSNCL